MLKSFKSIVVVSSLVASLGGGQCPGSNNPPGPTPTTPTVVGCVKDASKAGLKPGQQAWLDKNTALAPQMGAAIKPLLTELKAGAIGDLKDGSGKIVAVGNSIVFKLNDYPDVFFKINDAAAKEFVDEKITDSAAALKTVKDKGLNCLIIPSDFKIPVDGTNFVYAQQFYSEVKGELPTRDQFETLYTQFPNDSKLEASFKEMFKQRVDLSCNGDDIEPISKTSKDVNA